MNLASIQAIRDAANCYASGDPQKAFTILDSTFDDDHEEKVWSEFCADVVPQLVNNIDYALESGNYFAASNMLGQLNVVFKKAPKSVCSNYGVQYKELLQTFSEVMGSPLVAELK